MAADIQSERAARIPRHRDNDYTTEAARKRREFVRAQTGADLHHIGQYSFDPTVLPGNVENFTGVAQVPIGVAGPLRANYPGEVRYILSGSIDTDKKHSQINMLLTRGKRVVAEAVIRNELLQQIMGVSAQLLSARQVSLAGNFLVASANNGAHAANGLTAMFIATGQISNWEP